MAKNKFTDPTDLKEDFPHISLIIPYTPGMNKQKELDKCLASATARAEKEVQEKYSKEQSALLLKKLHKVVGEVRISKDEKTLAIFVSLIAQKIYYFTPSTGARGYMPPVANYKAD